jgi:hypothetical protein
VAGLRSLRSQRGAAVVTEGLSAFTAAPVPWWLASIPVELPEPPAPPAMVSAVPPSGPSVGEVSCRRWRPRKGTKEKRNFTQLVSF